MARGRPLDVEHELLEAFKQNGLVSEYLVSVLPAALWRMPPPNGRGRSLAAIIAHMQSVRRMFARTGGARAACSRSKSLDPRAGLPGVPALHRGSGALVRDGDRRP
jgi:hypothetical protein